MPSSQTGLLQFLFLVREHYVDFGPTLANEKLEAHHDVIVSTETLRGLMIEDGIWTLRSRRRRYSPAQSAPRVLWRAEDDSWDLYDDQGCTKKVGSSTVGMSVTLIITSQSVMRGQAPELGGYRACPIIRPGGPL